MLAGSASIVQVLALRSCTSSGDAWWEAVATSWDMGNLIRCKEKGKRKKCQGCRVLEEVARETAGPPSLKMLKMALSSLNLLGCAFKQGVELKVSSILNQRYDSVFHLYESSFLFNLVTRFRGEEGTSP